MANSISRSAIQWRLATAAVVLAVAGGAVQMAQAMPGGHGGHGGRHGGGGDMMLHGRVLQTVGASAD